MCCLNIFSKLLSKPALKREGEDVVIGFLFKVYFGGGNVHARSPIKFFCYKEMKGGRLWILCHDIYVMKYANGALTSHETAGLTSS